MTPKFKNEIAATLIVVEYFCSEMVALLSNSLILDRAVFERKLAKAIKRGTP